MEGTIVASFNVFQYSREGSEVNPEKTYFSQLLAVRCARLIVT
jgi:hypothetical protein